MKTLLNKKLTVLFFACAVCFTITNAQIPDHLIQSKKKGFYKSELSKQIIASKPDFDKTHNNKVPCLKKQTTLGGTGDDYGNKMIPTSDGGFIVAGATNSGDGDFHVPAADGSDAFIAKYNKFRQLQWAKTFGGSGDDSFGDIFQTSDGGYIATGQSSSTDGNVSGNHGGYDVVVVKYSASGKVEWQKSLGGSGDEFGDAVIQTIYGGYAITGFTNSNDGDVTGNHNSDGNSDAWLVQLGAKGNFLSQHCYGGSAFDIFLGLVRSDGGSLIIEGYTQSNDGDVSGNHGSGDAWVVKINGYGKIAWQQTVGGSNDDEASATIAKTTDGNVVIDGYSFSDDGDINGQDTLVSFMTKLNSSTGNIIWSRSYDKPVERGGFGVFATADGGTVETGAVGVIDVFETFDVLVSKFDANGKQEWYKRLGGSSYDAAQSGYESLNGNLNILCQTSSTDGDVKNNHGGVDTWLLKLGPCSETDEDELPLAVSEDNAVSISKDNLVSLSSFPNPFSNSTNISFSLPQSQKVSVQVFDGTGRLVKIIANEQMSAGTYQLTWNAADENGTAVAKGMYYLKFNAGSYSETKKIFLIK